MLVWIPTVQEDIHIREEFINGAEVIFVNDEIITAAIKIRKTFNKIKLPDAIIAAIALVYGLILLSDNDIDFKRIEALGLKYLNPKNIN